MSKTVELTDRQLINIIHKNFNNILTQATNMYRSNGVKMELETLIEIWHYTVFMGIVMLFQTLKHNPMVAAELVSGLIFNEIRNANKDNRKNIAKHIIANNNSLN